MGWYIEHEKTLDSTNQELKRRLETGKEPLEYTLLWVDEQTAGQGRGDNKWLSKSNENLTFSFVIYPDRQLEKQPFLLSTCIALALCDTIEPYVEAQIKWPNDIYCNSSKLAGVLIENIYWGSHWKAAICGIGLNVNQTEFDPTLPNPTSLRSVTGKKLNREEILHQFTTCFERSQKRCNYPHQMTEQYHKKLYRLHEWANYHTTQRGKIEGKILRVTTEGHLEIEERSGATDCYDMDEVVFL